MPRELATAETVPVAGILSDPQSYQPFQPAKPDVLERAIAATNHETSGRKKPDHKQPNRDQKAAIIIRLLQGDGGVSPISGLDTGQITALVHAMAGLSYVDEPTILAVIQDFLVEIDSLGMYFKPGVEGAIKTLGGLITEDVTARLAYTPTSDKPFDPWSGVSSMEVGDLVTILSNETPQIAAIVLSKLAAGTAAEILAEMAPDLAQAATQSALGIGKINASVIAEIGLAISETANATQDAGALPGDPIDRVGAMLNFAPGGARESLLNGLEVADAELADQLRKVMFTFGDIPDRIEIKDVAKVVRGVDNEILVMALAGGQISEKETVDFLFANLSKRLSEQLIEEVGEIGEVKAKDADRSMNAVVQGIRDLESAGELTLISPEE
ncbi:MAG: flagellar motor switch protein FliG [Paracoccaceae bacterium]